MRVELGFQGSLCLFEIERLKLRITRFTHADHRNILLYDPEITFWHVAPLSKMRVTRVHDRGESTLPPPF